MVLSIALYESKNFSTFLPRKCNVCGIMVETLLTVNIKCLKELDHITSVHIANFFFIVNSKHSLLTDKITGTFFGVFFFSLGFYYILIHSVVM